MRRFFKAALGAGLLFAVGLASAPAQAQRPWRITFGYDSSSLKANPYTTTGSGPYTTSESGALTFGVSYDFYRDVRAGVAGFTYANFGGIFFTNLYNGFGVGVRKELADVYGGNVYVRAGIGAYAVSEGNDTAFGGEFSLGLQLRGALFFEIGVPVIAESHFSNGATLTFGFRL